MERLGKVLVVVGIFVTAAGLVVWLFGDKLRWLGRLPGDIRIEKDNFRFYMPIATMIIVSVVITLVLWLIRYFNK